MLQEGFQYHHAEARYVMMTYWIPNEPCMLPANASHQVGVGGFVMNDNNEVSHIYQHCAQNIRKECAYEFNKKHVAGSCGSRETLCT